MSQLMIPLPTTLLMMTAGPPFSATPTPFLSHSQLPATASRMTPQTPKTTAPLALWLKGEVTLLATSILELP